MLILEEVGGGGRWETEMGGLDWYANNNYNSGEASPYSVNRATVHARLFHCLIFSPSL